MSFLKNVKTAKLAAIAHHDGIIDADVANRVQCLLASNQDVQAINLAN